MNPDDADTLERIAESIAEGRPIDWEREAREAPGLTGVLEELRLLETVGRVLKPATADPPDHGAPPIPPARWGPLRILDKVGEGSFGEIFKAFDSSLEREVALKLLHPDRSGNARIPDSSLAEARSLARVRHPNVLTVHGAARHDGRVGIWTDLVRGKTLEEMLKQGTFGAREATLIGLDLCRALAAIHAAGLVHRDIKASNVIREEGGRTVLLDFGAAGYSSGGIDSDLHPQGTPAVMAPEQFEGGPVGPAADVYGLGALLYRLVSGRYPIEAPSVEELRVMQQRGLFTPLRDLRPDLNSAFVGVVERALAPSVQERFPSAAAMERGLRAALELDADRSAPQDRLARSWRSRAPWIVLLASVAVVAILLLRSAPSGTRPPAATPSKGKDHASASATSRSSAIGGATGRSRTSQAVVVDATLFRKRAGREAPIATGDRVIHGDQLFLDISGDQPMSVYVLDEDRRGRLYVLFPLEGLDESNPLSAGHHRLPGRLGGAPLDWEVTSPGGKERIALVASRQPLAAIDQAIRGFPAARLGRPVEYGELGARDFEPLRGIGGLQFDTEAPGHSRLSALLGWLQGARDSLGVWVREIELDNPGP